MYIHDRMMIAACVEQPGGKLLKKLPRACLTLMKQALSLVVVGTLLLKRQSICSEARCVYIKFNL